MTDVTEYVDRYRLALRGLWNTSFWSDPSDRDWPAYYAFEKVKLPLFEALVTDRLQSASPKKVFGADFIVVPKDVDFFGEVLLNMGEVGATSGVWERLPKRFETVDLKASVVDFFDWTPMGYIDLRYYMVKIESFASRPEHVGKHALIDNSYCKVFWNGQAG